MEPEPEPMMVAVAEVKTAMAVKEFSVARPERVPADGTERKVLLTTQTLDARLRHVTAPRIDSAAYLMGEVVNSTEFPLLAGEAGVSLDGAYLGDFELDTVAPDDTFDIAFGIDDAVTVKRTPIKIDKGTKGAVGKRERSAWEWKVEVDNGHRRAIEVEVWEQVPLSSRQDVKVTRTGAVAPSKEENGGLLMFTLPVKSGAKGSVSWGYMVDYPSDYSVGWME
jgi:uncharacterized protein (TIGR02231 family)